MSDMVPITQGFLDPLEVPNNDIRAAILNLAEIFASTDDGAQMAIASAGLREMTKVAEEVYRKRSPLQEQVEDLRVRRQLKEEFGIDSPLPPT